MGRPGLIVATTFLSSTILLLVSLCPGHVQAQATLAAVELTAQLPTARAYMTALYDNDDTIYLFGGNNHLTGGSFDQTLIYSISADMIERGRVMPTVGSYGGNALLANDGGILYIPGLDGTSCSQNRSLLRYLPESDTYTNLGPIGGNTIFASVMPDKGTALLLGGWCHPWDIVKLDLNTRAQEVYINALRQRASWATGIWSEEQGVAYIFDGNSGTETFNVQKYSLATNTTELLPIKLATTFGIKAVSDGKYGYITGGFNWTEGSIIQFDMETEEAIYHPVEGYPGAGMANFDGTAPVYVEKLNRIYFFGGYTAAAGLGYHRQIWYISLDPLNLPPSTTTEAPMPTVDPDIFNCVGRPNAVHPFPGECAKFIICRDGHGYPFDCPEPLLFHPVNRGCTFPHLMDCEAVV